jgi:lysophospholipase L1-like esterase
MKLFKTLIFIFVLLALLATISIFFPKEGIQVGPLHFTFPNLREVLSFNIEDNSKEAELSPEEIQRREMEALKQAQDSTFMDFCMNSPIRISMPLKHQYLVDTITIDQYVNMTDSVRELCDSIKMIIDSTAVFTVSAHPDTLWVTYRDSITEERDMTYLDDFFAALDSARSHRVRILHYGDSQIEEDRITSGLREHFQEQFGGGGPGMMPAQKWVTKLTCYQNTTPELPYYVAYGTTTMHARHNGYGPMATVAHSYGNVRISYSAVKSDKFPHVRDYDRVTVLRNNPDGSGLQYLVQEFDTVRSRVTVNIEGPADIYGVLLDQKTGVAMDNVPMRGSSGNIFTRITRNTIVPFFENENVRLIILQYGGNSVPAMRTEKALNDFCKEIQRQVRFFKQIAPDAKILYIGPSDMSTNIGGEMRTYTLLPRFVELLDQYLTECGASFWNLFEAMGGQGSMVRWVAARPQLAGEDYVHFTHKGAEHVSDLLYETIDTYYKNYKSRHEEFIPGLTTNNEDSLNNDTVNVPAVAM